MAKKKISSFLGTNKVKGTFTRNANAANTDNLDDYNIVDSIDINSGTIQDTPTADKDIVNKAYVDSAAGGITSGSEVSHLDITNIGTHAHSVIDTHIQSGADHFALTNEHINWTATGTNLNAGNISGASVTSGAIAVYYRDSQVDHDATTNYVAAEHLTASTFATSGGATVSLGTHATDSSDPHGAVLTQTTINTTSGGMTADNDASGAAIFRNFLIGTEATPFAASNATQGTVYLQYTA
jgi:hypothetical protein|tara:strand:+ start:3808 stop:4527 length:720 start_codon:yes stop_codon:yes gene_type:complete